MDTINELINLSASKYIKKPTKEKAFSLLSDLISGAELSNNQKAQLIKTFLPPIPAKAKNNFDFCRKLAPQKDIRYYMNNVYATDSFIDVTNGYYAYRSPNCINLEPGFYNPKTGLIDESVNAVYPDLGRVIPEKTDRPIKLLHCATRVEKGVKEVPFVRIFEDDYGFKLAIDARYWDLLLSAPSELIGVYGKSGADTILLMYADGSVGIISPLRF